MSDPDATTEQLLRAGVNPHLIASWLQTLDDRVNALELIDSGMTATDLSRLVARVPLQLVVDAVEDGVPPALVVSVVIRNGTASLSIARDVALVDPHLVGRLVSACSNIAQDVEDLELAGCDLDDIAWLLEHNVPLLWAGRLVRPATAGTSVDTHEQLGSRPALVRRLAVAFALCAGVDALTMLPAALACADQPWAQTAVALSVDRGEPWQAIVAARAVEGDVTLPQADRHAWPALRLLGERARIGDQPHHAQAEAIEQLASGSGTDLVALLGDDAQRLGAEWPERVAWARPRSEWLAQAITNAGPQAVIDAFQALTGSANDPLGDHKMSTVVLPLACGMPHQQVRAWAHQGLDICAAAMLTAYGLDADQVVSIANTANAWHLLDLLAMGLELDDAQRMLPTLAGLGYRSVHGRSWGPPALGQSDLERLRRLRGAVTSDAGTVVLAHAGALTPDGLLELALVLNSRAQDGWSLPAPGAFALAAAGVGRGVLDDEVLDRPVPDGVDVAEHLCTLLSGDAVRGRHARREVHVTAASRSLTRSGRTQPPGQAPGQAPAQR